MTVTILPSDLKKIGWRFGDGTTVRIGWGERPEQSADRTAFDIESLIEIHLTRTERLTCVLNDVLNDLVNAIIEAGQDPNIILKPYDLSVANGMVKIHFATGNGETFDLDAKITELTEFLKKLLPLYQN